MRLLLDQLRTQWGGLAGVFALATINQLLLLAEPHVVRLIIDRWVVRVDALPWDVFFRGVLTLLAAGMLIALVARLARIYQDYGANLIAQRVSTRMYARSVAHSLLLPFTIFEDQRSGELLHKIQRARIDAQAGITQLVRLYLAGVAIATVTIYAFTVHHILGSFFAGLIPLLGASVFALSRPIRRQQVAVTRDAAAIAGSATEVIRNVELAKSLGLHQQEIARLDAANERLLSLERRKLRLVRLFTFAEGSIMSTARAALLLLMLWLLHGGAITIGEFLTFFIYAQWLFAPLSELGATIARYQEARASFEAVDEIMMIPPEQDHSGAAAGTINEIRFENVTLAFPGNTRPALENLNIVFRAGETVGLVGPSGSGKSSIVKLLTCLYQPVSGAVTVNGLDARKIDIGDYRGRIGLVSQETHLFAGTVRENLRLVRPDASDEQCLAALRRAAGVLIIERGDAGLDTRIGEGGLKLSGGERQRIAIARALLREPELLIFDEATSNLDAISERAITATISEIAGVGAQRITLVVAHRLSAVSHADRILVIVGGRVVETGNHRSLLKAGGLYAEMYEQQSVTQRK